LAARTTTATVFQNRDDQAFFKARRIVDGSASRLISGSGLDVEGFAAAQAAGPPPVRLREALGLGASEVVMTVTRLTRQKGVPTLLEAAALVHAVRPGVRFLLVGPRESEGPFAVSQAALDRHAPYVMAIGARRDVPALLRLADAFAFPSEYCEGLPRALLEAGLAGLPIVTTAMPGCGDVVRDGWNGFVVPPRAPRALAARILDLLGDRAAAAAMGRRSVDFVKRQFSLESVVAAYAALYAETLDRELRSARTGAAMDLRRQDHAAGI
jgi:glycosyltransferase involved in cell wall biosynthesis